MPKQTEDEPFVYPAHFYLIERDATLGEWKFKKGSTFYNPTGTPYNHDEKERYFGLTKPQMATELFRVNGGKSGWYLVDMRSRKYYYPSFVTSGRVKSGQHLKEYTLAWLPHVEPL